MRAVIQRVSSASVTVDGHCIGLINNGLLVLLAIHESDDDATIPWMVQKLLNLRIFEDETNKMNLSVSDILGGILIVSQFTLYGDCKKGRRPNFMASAEPKKAERLYDHFVSHLKAEYSDVACGKFAAKMDVALVNDGPVTLIIDSPT